MISSFREPADSRALRSRAPKSCAAALTCSAIVTLGSVTTNPGGSWPPRFVGESGHEEVEGAEGSHVELAR